MKQTRRKDSPAFKVEVVLAVLETQGVGARFAELGKANFLEKRVVESAVSLEGTMHGV